jgi:hypothetical protein
MKESRSAGSLSCLQFSPKGDGDSWLEPVVLVAESVSAVVVLPEPPAPVVLVLVRLVALLVVPSTVLAVTAVGTPSVPVAVADSRDANDSPQQFVLQKPAPTTRVKAKTERGPVVRGIDARLPHTDRRGNPRQVGGTPPARV